MKKTILIAISGFLFSCQQEQKQPKAETPEAATAEKGQVLFEANNCTACHKPDQKVIGPSLQEMARIYQEKQADMVAFLKEEADPIVDEKLYPTMKTNLQITKTLSDTELESLELYIMGHAQ